MKDLPGWLFDDLPTDLADFFPDFHMIYHASLPSTNHLAMQKLASGAKEGTLVITDHQVEGRGQKGTSWLSQAAQNLTFSLILRPDNLEKKLFELSKAVAVGLGQTIRELCPSEEVLIKWPNDILINRKKTAGILIESQWEGRGLKGTVAGIGVNVNQWSFPESIRHSATSVGAESGQIVDRGMVLWTFLRHFAAGYDRIQKGISIERDYLALLYGYQEPVAVRWKDGEGRFPILGVNDQGHLAIQLPEGIRHFDLKEIQFLF